MVAPPRRAPPSFRDCPMAVVAFVRKCDSPKLGNQPASLATKWARRAAVRVLTFLLFPPPFSMLSNQIEWFVPPRTPKSRGGEEHHLVDERAPVVTCRSSQQSPVPPPHPTGSGFGFVQPSHLRGRLRIVSAAAAAATSYLYSLQASRELWEGGGQERRGGGA